MKFSKKNSMIVCITFCFFFLLSGCGITEGLDLANDSMIHLEDTLKEQEIKYKQLHKLVQKIPSLFADDLEEKPETGLFPDEEGAVYENFQERKKLLDELEKQQKEIEKTKKTLEKILKKNAVDVENEKIDLIVQSLEIINSNFNSCKSYADTGFKQEEHLYQNLPMKDFDKQVSLVQKTYGAILILSEETRANIEYTLSLTNDYLSTTTTGKK